MFYYKVGGLEEKYMYSFLFGIKYAFGLLISSPICVIP